MFRKSLITFALILNVGTPVISSKCLGKKQNEACKMVFNPDNMNESCSTPMNQFVEEIGKCHKKLNNTKSSCLMSKCVTGEYKVLTDDNIDENKVLALLARLTKEDPSTEKLNQAVRDNCLRGQYRKYVTTDPNCKPMMFQVCAFVNYLIATTNFHSSPSHCEQLKRNVFICRPVLQQYLNQPKRCK